MKEIFFETDEKRYFWLKPDGVILHDRNFDSTKSSIQTCLTLRGRMDFVSIFSSEKNQLQIGKNCKKRQKIFFITLFATKNPERKELRHHF